VRPDRRGALRRAAGRIASRLRSRRGADDEALPPPA